MYGPEAPDVNKEQYQASAMYRKYQASPTSHSRRKLRVHLENARTAVKMTIDPLTRPGWTRRGSCR